MSAGASYTELLTVLRGGDSRQKAALLEACPPSPMKDGAAALVKSDDPATVVIGVGILAGSYSFGLSAAFGADLSRAGFELAQDVWATQPPGGPLLLTTVSGLASAAIRSLKLQGRSEEAIAFAERAVPYLEQQGDTENLPTIQTDHAEALLQLGRVDEAERILAEARARGGFAPDLERLQRQVQSIKRPVTELAGPAPTNEGNPAATPEGHAALRGLADLITGFMTKSSGEMNEFTAMKISRDATAIFLDDRLGRQPAALGDSLEKLEGVRRWSSANQAVDVENDALWGIYLCLSRLDRPAEAADALLDLRRNVERLRAGITNPVERGGVSVKYPYLYPSLCQMLAKTGRGEELLDSMEAAKGRAVADLLARRLGRPVADGEQAVAARRVRELTERVGAHYVSYFVDDDSTLAVLVANDGSLHMSGAIPLGKEEVRAASRLVDPRTWGAGDPTDLWARKTADVPTSLSPLVQWLGPLLEEGVVKRGDHLCYSPDEHLHQIPLHYIHLNGEPLVSSLSVSRTHGTHLLSLILASEPRRPQHFNSVVVPSGSDGAEMREAMARVPSWLARRVKGTLTEGEDATLASLTRMSLTNRVVHFSTHGYFPPEGDRSAANPYAASGLLLAGPGGLPDLDDPGASAKLSPKALLDSRLDLSGSHISLAACVTGLAREGVGGDALGLDWALFQCGAASLLASHWNVSAALSASFFERFYDGWLLQRMGRAEAWRATILSMMGENGPESSPYAWGAFSLSGDWR